ncbi:MAG: radical SAM protein [Bacteriovoracaceae bacterium]|nr:radical SAM protein [Bacteriovoracaceae bacterium]
MKLNFIHLCFNLVRKMNLPRSPIIWSRILFYWVVVKLSFFLKTINLRLPPLNTLVFVTLRCNKACSFCHYIDGLNCENSDEYEMNLDTFTRILNSRKICSVGRICFYGGEPLLNSDIFKMIDLAKSRNYITSIFTNGLLLEKYKEKILEGNVDFITISYYQEDIDNIFNIVKELSPHVAINISYMVSEGRLDELPVVFENCNLMGVGMITIENYLENDHHSEIPLCDHSEQFYSMKNELTMKYSGHYLIRWSELASDWKKNRKISCTHFWDTRVINAKGELLPCCHYPLSEFDDGDGFLNTDKMRFLRKSFKDGRPNRLCENCHFLQNSELWFKF